MNTDWTALAACADHVDIFDLAADRPKDKKAADAAKVTDAAEVTSEPVNEHRGRSVGAC